MAMVWLKQRSYSEHRVVNEANYLNDIRNATESIIKASIGTKIGFMVLWTSKRVTTLNLWY